MTASENSATCLNARVAPATTRSWRVLAEAHFILHGWLRSENTGAARGVVPFLQEALALLALLGTFNLLNLYQHRTTPAAPYWQSATLEVAVFLCEAILGGVGRDVVGQLPVMRRGPGKRKPLVDVTLVWLRWPSLKLVPPEDRAVIGGGMS